MNQNVLIGIGATVTIGLVSALITYWRAERMSSPAELASKGLAAVQKGNVILFGVVLPLAVGPVAIFVFRSMLKNSPESAHTTFLLLTIGIAILLSIMVAVESKMRGFIEFTILYILYVAGFGWIIPMLWTR